MRKNVSKYLFGMLKEDDILDWIMSQDKFPVKIKNNK